jgi:hypothetical protein
VSNTTYNFHLHRTDCDGEKKSSSIAGDRPTKKAKLRCDVSQSPPPHPKRTPLPTKDKDNGTTDVMSSKYEHFYEESRQEKLTLPSYAQVELRDFHKRSSALGKLLTYQQTLQLGISAVKVCFAKAIHGNYTKDKHFMEQLFCVIFFKCGERRMMLEGKLMLAELYCDKENALTLPATCYNKESKIC